MKKAPSLITINNFRKDAPRALINNKWVFSRPLGFYGLRSRLRLACGVFTGKYDAFKWEEGQ
jgi:hypothetical protein